MSGRLTRCQHFFSGGVFLPPSLENNQTSVFVTSCFCEAPRFQDKYTQTDSSEEEHVSSIHLARLPRGSIALLSPSQRTLFAFTFFAFFIIFTSFYIFFTTCFDNSDNVYIEFSTTDVCLCGRFRVLNGFM